MLQAVSWNHVISRRDSFLLLSIIFASRKLLKYVERNEIIKINNKNIMSDVKKIFVAVSCDKNILTWSKKCFISFRELTKNDFGYGWDVKYSVPQRLMQHFVPHYVNRSFKLIRECFYFRFLLFGLFSWSDATHVSLVFFLVLLCV